MSTATKVPQTRDLSGDELSADDAWSTLKHTGVRTLLRDSFIRFRYSDGFSHARALAFQICLAVIPAVIALFGLSTTVHHEAPGQILARVLDQITPGASQPTVRAALDGAQADGAAGGVALWLGLVVAFVSTTTAMGQIERGANRIYGVERDRPFPRKYSMAAALAALAGVPMACGLVVVVAGGAVGDALAAVYHWPHPAHLAWICARWPLGIALAVISASIIFRNSPRRRQPAVGWLAFGAGLALLLWVVFTALLAWYVKGSTTFGATYGPLTAIMALLVWANLTAIALFLGLAAAAQLEAVRAGVLPPIKPDPGA
ncbi:YihY/virulence factor BrkB family protein [Actinospica durhamensis]|uniref:YihY/virulence factor BrkB family protein n=1 Tax=Actinospica durhamensis TaxID=1508375 RepID=A0A941ESX8_9ACTN|nr:YihY/virulence factor BrkB family protein [Actinospica durhamensis]MBR7836618.1 YihY/virulence factor BrkB family protein [Actinospica durhamensis]